eukprot:1001421-Amorphochlora_amoeboformis.AAC.4
MLGIDARRIGHSFSSVSIGLYMYGPNRCEEKIDPDPPSYKSEDSSNDIWDLPSTRCVPGGIENLGIFLGTSLWISLGCFLGISMGISIGISLGTLRGLKAPPDVAHRELTFSSLNLGLEETFVMLKKFKLGVGLLKNGILGCFRARIRT